MIDNQVQSNIYFNSAITIVVIIINVMNLLKGGFGSRARIFLLESYNAKKRIKNS